MNDSKISPDIDPFARPLRTVSEYRKLLQRHGGGRGTIEVSQYNVIILRVPKAYIPDVRKQTDKRRIVTDTVIIEQLTVWQRWTLWSIKVLNDHGK